MREDFRKLAAPLCAAYVAFHLWETSAAIRGREAFAERLSGKQADWIDLLVESALILLLVAFVCSNLVRPVAHDANAGRGFKAFGLVITSVSVLFLVVHVGHTWGRKVFHDFGPHMTYDSLKYELGKPWMTTFYVFGVTSFFFFLARPLDSWVMTLPRLSARERSLGGLRVAVVLLVMFLFLLAINTLAHFVTGRAFVLP